ncbi:MAG: thymidine phosphorylase [Cephaloticoccus sp.]|nr:thymidine phosphorylase [Cephaloticoccus sp.]MCF7759288.1 thymidine phosphorylase [Cephaloticoccus sp.]
MSPSLFPQHIIAQKRDGGVLSRAEIGAFVRGATDGSWADYQLSALLMAIFLRGMTPEETALYTDAMMRSGVVADLTAVPGIKVDKHSTGGVGDKVSIPLAPMVVACGVPVPMISGRGLGHSGGTLDKLESIPGFRTDLSLADYCAQVARIGCALIGQTKDLAPSDKKLYALRDVTATVECIPLICGSILAKKLAEGIDALVLDVKFGRGAFMKTEEQARELAHALVQVGRAGGKKVRALLTAMNQPLGRTVGNALEVGESIACLHGEGPADLMEVTYALGAQMLLLGGKAEDVAEAEAKLQAVIADGSALEKFREIVVAQGGDGRVVDEPDRLPQASHKVILPAPATGIITDVDAMQVALAALRLGAGRAKAEDRIDPGVGVSGLVKIGEPIEAGAALCTIHASDASSAKVAVEMLGKAIRVGNEAPPKARLIGELLS